MWKFGNIPQLPSELFNTPRSLLAAEGCWLLSGVCKRKSCLRAQIFVTAMSNTQKTDIKDSEPNPTPFLQANPSWIAGLIQVSFLKALSECQLPESPCVPLDGPSHHGTPESQICPFIPPPRLLQGDPTLLLAHLACQGKQSQVTPAYCPQTLLQQLSSADCPLTTASITGRFAPSCLLRTPAQRLHIAELQ